MYVFPNCTLASFIFVILSITIFIGLSDINPAIGNSNVAISFPSSIAQKPPFCLINCCKANTAFAGLSYTIVMLCESCPTVLAIAP